MVRTRRDGNPQTTSSEEEEEESSASKRTRFNKRSSEETGATANVSATDSETLNMDLENARASLPPDEYKKFAHLFAGVLKQANKSAHRIAESQMEQIQAENARSAERQRTHEENMAIRQREDAERFADKQRIHAEAAAQRQRDHEIDMARIVSDQTAKSEERQKVIFEQLLEKNSKSFKATLEKEGEKEEKREKEKTSSQGALFHPLSATVGDAPLTDLPKDPGNSADLYNIAVLFHNKIT
jgi:hypothetical protein